MSNGIVITLDAGHGEGYNKVKFQTTKYPTNLTYAEGTRMFDYSIILKAELEKRGYTVYLTRKTVKDDPTLKERGRFAAEKKSMLFLSLHSNAKESEPDKKGIVCVYSMADKEWNKPLAQKIAEADAKCMGNGIVDVFWMESKVYDGKDYFGVLRLAAEYGCKHGIIVEHGYHTNYNDAFWLSKDENLAKLAKAEADAVDEYLKTKTEKEVEVRVKQVKSGAKNTEVATVQTLLNQYSYRDSNGKKLAIDGIFGANTDFAVKAFQKANGLTVDGIVGKNTWSILLKG